MRLDEGPFTVIGILPPEFRLREPSSARVSGHLPIWIPVGADGNRRSEGSHSYWAIGRLAPGATIHQARTEAEALIPAPGDDSSGVRMDALVTMERYGLTSPLLLLLMASGALLLIACGNVATLLLGEAHGRMHEVATRAALGAGNRRLVRQLLTESVLLGVGGAVAGIGLALAGTRLLLAHAPPLPRLDQVAVSPGVLLFAAVLGLLTGILFGLAPAAKLGLGGSLRSLTTGWRGSSRGRSAFQRSIVAVELALAMVLLVSGTLLARSLGQLMAVDPGFQTEQLAMVRAILPRYRYTDPRDLANQVERM